MLSSAREWASVILVGKCDSGRHSTTSFSKNVNNLSTVSNFHIIFRSGEGLSSFNTNNPANFGEKS